MLTILMMLFEYTHTYCYISCISRQSQGCGLSSSFIWSSWYCPLNFNKFFTVKPITFHQSVGPLPNYSTAWLLPQTSLCLEWRRSIWKLWTLWEEFKCVCVCMLGSALLNPTSYTHPCGRNPRRKLSLTSSKGWTPSVWKWFNGTPPREKQPPKTLFILPKWTSYLSSWDNRKKMTGGKKKI